MSNILKEHFKLDEYYLKDYMRRTKLGNRVSFWLVFILSLLSYFLFDFTYWWIFPILDLISALLSEIVSLKFSFLMFLYHIQEKDASEE